MSDESEYRLGVEKRLARLEGIVEATAESIAALTTTTNTISKAQENLMIKSAEDRGRAIVLMYLVPILTAVIGILVGHQLP